MRGSIHKEPLFLRHCLPFPGLDGGPKSPKVIRELTFDPIAHEPFRGPPFRLNGHLKVGSRLSATVHRDQVPETPKTIHVSSDELCFNSILRGALVRMTTCSVPGMRIRGRYMSVITPSWSSRIEAMVRPSENKLGHRA